jgi:hypothetical protein
MKTKTLFLLIVLYTFSCNKNSDLRYEGTITIEGARFEIYLVGVDSMNGYFSYSEIQFKTNRDSKPTMVIEPLKRRVPNGYDVQVEDVNFDGHPDFYIALEESYGRFASSALWLYNPATKQFDYSDFLESAAPFYLDQQLRELVFNANSSMWQFESRYAWIDGKFELLRSTETTLSPSGIKTIIEFTNRNGELQKVSERVTAGELDLKKSGSLTRKEDILEFLTIFDSPQRFAEVDKIDGAFFKLHPSCTPEFLSLMTSHENPSPYDRFLPYLDLGMELTLIYAIAELNYAKTGYSFNIRANYAGTSDSPLGTPSTRDYVILKASYNEEAERWEFQRVMSNSYGDTMYFMLPYEADYLDVSPYMCEGDWYEEYGDEYEPPMDTAAMEYD